MKKKLMMMILAFTLCLTSVFAVNMQVNAEEMDKEISYESLLTEDALVGYTQSQTRGVYLSSGTSIINDAGGGKIGAGGSTTAAIKCKVSVNVVVERKVGSSWVRVTSWTATKTSALVVSTGKTISVASGYYYRVRCNHAAASDGSSSYTGALWM
ncbi:MAG: hypothetical protein IJE60_01350 [Tyzzerella sp.]|nr:hypothetical protein [Tyzzerella sp.]